MIYQMHFPSFDPVAHELPQLIICMHYQYDSFIHIFNQISISTTKLTFWCNLIDCIDKYFLHYQDICDFFFK
jgi:hypothetical protein